jgi:hypothetical protein
LRSPFFSEGGFAAAHGVFSFSSRKEVDSQQGIRQAGPRRRIILGQFGNFYDETSLVAQRADQLSNQMNILPRHARFSPFPSLYLGVFVQSARRPAPGQDTKVTAVENGADVFDVFIAETKTHGAPGGIASTA